MKILSQKLGWLIIGLIVLSSYAMAQKEQTVLPVRYDEDRFIVEPETEKGQKISFFTDTGGGLFIYKDAAEKLASLKITGEEIEPIDFPTFKTNSYVPSPLGSKGKLYVFTPPPTAPKLSNSQGMLGQTWFAGRIWTFDYPTRRLILWNQTPEVFREKSSQIVNLGFKTDESNKRVLNFPRIQAEIDGEVLELLFDTGATTFLTKEALDSLKDNGKEERATSFITTTTFERWRKAHPTWHVIEKAEMRTGEAMIEVPEIKIAGYTIGPVWFTRRPDKNFHEYMSKFMDKQVEGAIGGNALRNFRITIDYPQAKAVFERE